MSKAQPVDDAYSFFCVTEAQERAAHEAIRNANPDIFFRAVVEDARRGDAMSARSVLFDLAKCVSRREPVPNSILNYLADAFTDHLRKGIAIDKALNLRRRAARPEGTTIIGRVQVLASLYWLTDSKGLSKEDAKIRVSEVFGLATRTIEKYDSQYRRGFPAEAGWIHTPWSNLVPSDRRVRLLKIAPVGRRSKR